MEVEPVGRWFHVYEARRLRGHLTSSAGESEEESEEEEAQEVEVEDDIHYLRSLNPADWKVSISRAEWSWSPGDVKGVNVHYMDVTIIKYAAIMQNM